MAKRLSKALRGKRRWIGIQISADISSRAKLKSIIETIASQLELSTMPKLMDFDQRVYSNGCGTGIIQVKLPDYNKLREYLSSANSLHQIGISSLTSSGKIRLVRERLSVDN